MITLVYIKRVSVRIYMLHSVYGIEWLVKRLKAYFLCLCPISPKGLMQLNHWSFVF